MPLIGLDWLFQRKFQYSQEACTWLDKQHFLAEIENIYNCAQEVLLDCQKRRDRRKVCVNDKKGRYEKQRLSQEWK